MIFSDLKLKWKISLLLGLLLVPSTILGLAFIFHAVKAQVVYTSLSGLMNFVDSKQQGVIRFLGQNEKLAKQLAVLTENASPEVIQKQFQTIVETDVFSPEEHKFHQEIKDGHRHISTWQVYHAIDFIRDGVIEISSDPARIGRKMETLPDVRHGYSNVYLEGDVPILSFGATSDHGMVYIHARAGMLTLITNGEIGNLEGDMGAYYLAGIGKTFDYYIVDRNNVMITDSRVYPDSLLQRTGSEFPWMMTMGKALELGIRRLPNGTYKTNAGHYTGQREAMGLYPGHSGKEMIGVSMPFYDSEWTIVVEQEAEELLVPLYSLAYQTSLWALGILASILLAGFYLASSISRPLSVIVKDVIHLRNGNTEIKLHETNRKDEIGNLATALDVFRENIIEKKHAEENLRKLSTAVEQSSHMIFITNTDGIIEYINPKFTEWLGYSPEEAIGKTPSLIRSGETPREVYENLWSTILSGKEWRGEIKDRRKDGNIFWASAAIAPVRDNDGRLTHFIAVHEDITHRKAAEQALMDAHRAAELANKAKTDLMANMSHELRTPLNAIIGFSESMKCGIFGELGNAHYEEYAEHIHASGTHLLQLINDILDVSAVEAGKLELHEQDTNVIDICEGAIRIIDPKAQECQITVSGIKNVDLPPLLCDPLRLKQILINLLSNAVKFTPEQGLVSCDAYLDESNDMIISVTDTGIGMDEAGMAKALDKFGQVDSSLSRAHDGTGLGLPLTKGLIELHGGTMELASRHGEGTKVTVRFPAERVQAIEHFVRT